VKLNIFKNRASHSIAEKLNKFEFMQRVSSEISEALNHPACCSPMEARNQWAEMNPSERLAFVSAGLECFYWIYISRSKRFESISYPAWENAPVNQQIITAASFCLFVLGTEFEQQEYEVEYNMDALSTNWVN